MLTLAGLYFALADFNGSGRSPTVIGSREVVKLIHHASVAIGMRKVNRIEYNRIYVFPGKGHKYIE